jgi:hypothetical protein
MMELSDMASKTPLPKDQGKLEQSGKPSAEPNAAPREDVKQPVVEFVAEAPVETVRAAIAELPGAKAPAQPAADIAKAPAQAAPDVVKAPAQAAPNVVKAPAQAAPDVAKAPAQAAPDVAKAPARPVLDVGVKVAAEPIVLRPEPQSEPKSDTSPAAVAQAEAFVTLGFSAPVKAASQWHQTAVDLWSENAVALLDFASQLAQATSVSDVIALNSRFAQERFQGFARLSSEYVEFAHRAATDSGWAAFRFTKLA